MKNQVNRSDDHEYEQEKRFSRSVILAILNFFGLVTFSILLATGMTINIIFIIILIIFESTDIYDMINSKLIIKDIKKNKMFVDYEEILSDNNKINQNVLSNTSSKTQELVSSIPEQKTIFNLNNIDKISYKDLKQILENIKREEKFDFDYSNIQDEKPMILSKKRK